MGGKMVKKFISIIIISTVLCTVLPEQLSPAKIEKGVTIDIARKYYSKDSLKKIVQQISEYNGSYLQLHFSDNENYTINSNYLDQTANKKNKYFLTKSELEELIKFANKKNIQVIPDIDLPSHSKGWLTLLRKKDEDLYRNVVSNYSNEMVDYHNNKASILVSRKLIKEILVMFEQPKFKNEQKIVLGGDEVPGSIRQQDDFINFMNEITKVALEGNYTVKLWNDSITTNGLKTLNNNIIIMFWQRKSSDLASVDDFLKQDYSIENYNSYSYYLFPSLNEGLQDFNINKSNIIKANLNDFSDLNNDFTKYVGTNINGENITFWGEHADDMTQDELVDYVLSYIEVFLTN